RPGEDHTVTFGFIPLNAPGGPVPVPPTKPALPPNAPLTTWSNWPGPPFLWAPATPSGAPYSGSGFVNSGMLGHGEGTFNVSFPTAGDYNYLCLLHPKMTGKVHVQAAGTP